MFDFNKNINESLKSELKRIDFKIQQYKELGNYDEVKRLLRLKSQKISNAKKQVKQKSNRPQYNHIQNEQPIESERVNLDFGNIQLDDDIVSNDDIADEIINIEQDKQNQLADNKIGRLVQSIDTDNLAFKSALMEIADAHEKILDLYEYTLYEDTWTETTITKFEELLDKYNTNLSQIQSMLPSIDWKSEAIKHEFMRVYKELIKADADSWNRVYARHNNYLRYRTNRRSIISQIADIIGGVKNTKDANYQDIFKYFNNRCADIRLYDNSNKSDKQDVLSKWLKPHLNEVMDEMKDRGIFNGAIDSVDIFKVFRIYVKCRKLAYAIFNLMTSNSEFNGYNRWHNQFINYCDANLNDKQLEQLMNAVNSENQFENVDDYQNIMDEESWEKKGIYESWLDDSLEYYHSHKDRYNKSKINKINMIPTNANQCRVSCDGNYVYANTTFYPGDIIEICPTKNIDKSSLYSRDMRDSVFEVIPNKKWVLPFGYCRYYLHDVALEEQNCTYIWDPIKNVIVIKAINKIPKYSKLFLKFIA